MDNIILILKAREEATYLESVGNTQSAKVINELLNYIYELNKKE